MTASKHVGDAEAVRKARKYVDNAITSLTVARYTLPELHPYMSALSTEISRLYALADSLT